MIITSPAFAHGADIPGIHSQEGANLSPPITISDVPAEAKSLVLIMDDPDAPRGTFTHWVVFNIDPHLGEIPENTVPPGSSQAKNTADGITYRGPKPQSGTHRYFFRVHALDRRLSLNEGASRETVEQAMESHVLATAELMGRYTAGSFKPAA